MGMVYRQPGFGSDSHLSSFFLLQAIRLATVCLQEMLARGHFEALPVLSPKYMHKICDFHMLHLSMQVSERTETDSDALNYSLHLSTLPHIASLLDRRYYSY